MQHKPSRTAGILLLAAGLGLLQGCASPCDDPGVVLVESAADLEAVVDCEVMQGQLTVQGADDLVTFSLPNLREIAGPIHFNGNANLASVSFEALVIADHTGIPRAQQAGIAFQLNPKLASIRLPALTTIGSAARPVGLGAWLNGELKTLEVPSLERVFGALSFANTQLTSLSFPRLKKLTELDIRGNTPLQSLSLPDLESLSASLRLREQNLLETLSLPRLRSIGSQGGGVIELVRTGVTALDLPLLESVGLGVTIEENHALASVDFGGVMDVLPLLVVERNPSLDRLAVPDVLEIGTLRVRVNQVLTSLEFDALRKVDGLEVTANPKLPTCDVTALVAQVEAADGVRQAIVEQNLRDACGR